MKFSQKDHDNFLIEIKKVMLSNVIIDSAIYAINNLFFEHAFCEGGDDLIAEYDSNKFVYQMTIRLTEPDVLMYDLDKDLELYEKKRNEVLRLIKENKLVIDKD